jgi:hypothetical protein
MQMNGTKRRMLSITAVALMALMVVPLFASSASATAVAPSTLASSGKSAEWAFGGEGWAGGGISGGLTTLTWNASAGAVVIFNATNTSASTIELTASRTVVVAVSATYTAPGTSWAYNFKVVELDKAYVNLSTVSTVTLTNKTVVPALGVLNASVQANASLKASLVGVVGNKSTSDLLNVSGWAWAKVAFDPSLGLVPLNLTGVTGWHSWANASGSAAWNLTWAYVDHGWNGTTGIYSGNISGTWSKTTMVVLFGRVAGTYAKWVDHRLRTAVILGLSGPFDLYSGFLLIPHDFDLFGGGVTAYAGAGVGATAVTSEYLFVTNGPRYLWAGSVSAANMTAGAPTPTTLAVATGGAMPAVLPSSSGSANPTVWEQPESPSAAQNQAYCLQFGCSSGAKPLGGLVLLGGIVGVAAVVAIALVLRQRSRGRRGQPAGAPISAPPSAGPTPPTGANPPGPAPPPP